MIAQQRCQCAPKEQGAAQQPWAHLKLFKAESAVELGVALCKGVATQLCQAIVSCFWLVTGLQTRIEV